MKMILSAKQLFLISCITFICSYSTFAQTPPDWVLMERGDTVKCTISHFDEYGNACYYGYSSNGERPRKTYHKVVAYEWNSKPEDYSKSKSERVWKRKKKWFRGYDIASGFEFGSFLSSVSTGHFPSINQVGAAQGRGYKFGLALNPYIKGPWEMKSGFRIQHINQRFQYKFQQGTTIKSGNFIGKANYLQLPLQAQFTRGKKTEFYAGAGPTFNMLLLSKRKGTQEAIDELRNTTPDVVYDDAIEASFSTFTIDMEASIGVKFRAYYDPLTIELFTTQSVTPIVKNPNLQYRTYGIRVSYTLDLTFNPSMMKDCCICGLFNW